MALDLVGKAVKYFRLPAYDYIDSPITVIPVQEGDVNSRYFEATIYDDRGDMDLSAYTKAELWAINPQGVILVSECQINDSKTVGFDFSGTLTSTVGKCVCTIVLTNAEELSDATLVLNSRTFYVSTHESETGEEGIENDPNYSKLLEWIKTIREATEAANSATADSVDATTQSREQTAASVTATEEAIEATKNADTATTNATSATARAITAAGDAETWADLAQTATREAEEATTNAISATENTVAATNDALAATTAANTATQNANTATTNADNATASSVSATKDCVEATEECRKVIGLTVPAEVVDAEGTSVQISKLVFVALEEVANE